MTIKQLKRQLRGLDTSLPIVIEFDVNAIPNLGKYKMVPEIKVGYFDTAIIPGPHYVRLIIGPFPAPFGP